MGEWGLAVIALGVSAVSVIVAVGSVVYARQSASASVRAADAATRSADVAEEVEIQRQHGWRIEARQNDAAKSYALRNVGTIDARDVTLAGNFFQVGFRRTDGDDDGPVHIAAGQARLFGVKHSFSRGGVEVVITWTPDLPDAESMTWTEVLPISPPAEDQSTAGLVDLAAATDRGASSSTASTTSDDVSKSYMLRPSNTTTPHRDSRQRSGNLSVPTLRCMLVSHSGLRGGMSKMRHQFRESGTGLSNQHCTGMPEIMEIKGPYAKRLCVRCRTAGGK